MEYLLGQFQTTGHFMAFALVVVIVSCLARRPCSVITDPVEVVARIPNTLVLAYRALTFAIATVGDQHRRQFCLARSRFGERRPKAHRLQTRGVITLSHRPPGHTWNIYSPVAINYLGGLGVWGRFGIIRRLLPPGGRVDRDAPSRRALPHWYQSGFNRRAVLVFVVSAVIAVVGLVPALGLLSCSPGAGVSA